MGGGTLMLAQQAVASSRGVSELDVLACHLVPVLEDCKGLLRSVYYST